MSESGKGRPPGLEAAELAALVVGREPPEAVARLRALSEHLAAGRLPDRAELALLERMRGRYGHELSEMEHPEPW